MNFLYLEVGGSFQEILHMDYWRFVSILKSLNKVNSIKSGKPYTEAGIPQSNQDLIDRRKQQR